MNKEFQNDGDRLKEVLTKSIGKERIILPLQIFQITNTSCRTIEVNSYFYNFPMIRLIRNNISLTIYLLQCFLRSSIYLKIQRHKWHLASLLLRPPVRLHSSPLHPHTAPSNGTTNRKLSDNVFPAYFPNHWESKQRKT